MNISFLLACLLGVFVCVETACSIMCFACEQQKSILKCLHLTQCPKDAQKCLTIGSLSRRGNDTDVLITKICVPKCPTFINAQKRASNSVYCCHCSLCNIWPPKP